MQKKNRTTFVQIPESEFDRLYGLLDRVDKALTNNEIARQSSSIEDPVFVNEIAKILGLKVSTVYSNKSRGLYPPDLITKIPNSSRLVASRSKLIEWVMSNSIQSKLKKP